MSPTYSGTAIISSNQKLVWPDFFEYVEKWFFKDIETMLLRSSPDEEGEGGLNYSILLLVLIGMELMGFILSNGKYRQNENDFKEFWSYLESSDSNYSDQIRKILWTNRNTAAHKFFFQSNIGVHKNEKSKHLKTDNEILHINVDTFFSDFKKQYANIKNLVLASPDEYSKAFKEICKKLKIN